MSVSACVCVCAECSLILHIRQWTQARMCGLQLMPISHQKIHWILPLLRAYLHEMMWWMLSRTQAFLAFTTTIKFLPKIPSVVLLLRPYVSIVISPKTTDSDTYITLPYTNTNINTCCLGKTHHDLFTSGSLTLPFCIVKLIHLVYHHAYLRLPKNPFGIHSPPISFLNVGQDATRSLLTSSSSISSPSWAAEAPVGFFRRCSASLCWICDTETHTHFKHDTS